MNDLRTAARGLLRAPALAASAILCLAVGLGATTAITSAIDRVLIRPLPFRDPGRLVTVYRTAPQANDWPFSPADYTDFARGTRQLDGLAAFTDLRPVLTLRDRTISLRAQRVTGNLFHLLGVRPLRGRLLTPADDSAGHDLVVVIGETLWRDQFGADPTLVGRTIRLDDQPRTVVGITPADCRIPNEQWLIGADVWVPMRFSPGEATLRESHYLKAMGRLAPGASIASARGEMTAIHSALAAVHPHLRGEGIRVEPMQADGVRAVRTPLLLLFGAVWAVLLIAATNVASLLLARGVARRREMAVRTALGGSRWAIVRPVLAESLLLAGIGGVIGLGLAWAGVHTIGALAASRVPQLDGLTIDIRILTFALVVSAAVALVCAAVPALRTAAVDPQEALGSGRGGGTGRTTHGALGALVVAEVALALVLLVGCGLVLRGFATLVSKDPGFDPRPLLTLKATVSPNRYPGDTAVRRFLEPALAAIDALPGVEAAASIQLLPYDDWGWNSSIRYEGRPGDDMAQLPLVEDRDVTPGFFRVTGQRLLSGRLLRDDDDDRPGVPLVAIVNEALAKRDFPRGDAVGKRYYAGDTTFVTIVGVVSDIRNVGPIDDPRPEVYYTYRQAQSQYPVFSILVRVRGSDPSAVAASVRSAIRRIDPQVAVDQVRPMTSVIAGSVGTPRFYLTLLAVFAAVALVLAIAGVYGVMSYAVVQRTRELGIRSALGSSSGQILQLVARRGIRLVAIGVVLGVASAMVASRLLRGMLYGVSPVDTSTWVITVSLLVGAGVVATIVPALRATRVDPLLAIRVE